MAQRNKGARRRKAFADFKENQYNDSFSISDSQKRKILFKSVFKYVFIVIVTLVFIAVGFVLSDALLDISEKPYSDPNTYTPTYPTEETTTLFSVENTEEENENPDEENPPEENGQDPTENNQTSEQ